MKKHIIGIDVGGTKCAISYGLYDGENIELVAKEKIKTGKPQDTLLELKALIDKILAAHNLVASDISSMGISCGGPLDSHKGVILSPPNLPGWDEIAIVDFFEGHYHVPVYLQNDANACALAEWRMGAGRGTQNMVFLTFGTGLGAGLILNGQLYAGTNSNAGELVHIRLGDYGPVGYGKSGSFEGFCSGGGIAQLARLMVMEKFQLGETVSWCSREQINEITAQQVAEAAFQGDELAKKIYQISATYLGKGLAIVIDLLNPDMIVIGSIYTRANQLMEKYVREVLEKEALSQAYAVCQIKPAVLEENIGDYAALSVATLK
jgi:glucokinase